MEAEPQSQGLFYYLLYWAVSALGVLITSKLITGFKISGFGSAIFAAVMIALVNTFIWPILIFLTLPINILTLGLFTFVINGAVIKIAAAFLPGFEVNSWWAAILGAVIFSIINTILHYVFV